MSYSEKFWPEGAVLDEAEAAALAQEVLAGAGAGSIGAAAHRHSDLAHLGGAQPVSFMPLANPEAQSLYPEHLLIGAIWLASVAGALIQIF